MVLLTALLPMVGLTMASPIEKRQLEPLVNVAGAVLPSIRAQNIQLIDASKNIIPGTKKVQFKYGPLELRAQNVKSWLPFNGGSMDPSGTAFFRTMDTDFPRNITVLNSEMKFVMEDGSAADLSKGVYQHHAQLIDTSKRAFNAFECVNGNRDWTTPAMSIFMGGGTNSADGSWFINPKSNLNSGFYIGPSDNIFMQLDIVNYNNFPQKIYLIGELEFKEGKPDGLLDTSIQLANVGACTGEGLYVEVPKGKKQFTLSGKKMKVTRDGNLISAMGHLHDGATDLTLKVNDQVACKSEATYGKETPGAAHAHMLKRDGGSGEHETIKKMSFCRDIIPVKKGDTILLEANYDYEKHPPRTQSTGGMAENMGVLSAYFATKEF